MTLVDADNRLGNYLKDRRARLDPAAFGLPLQRRRTPGLRREEVAQRAHVSATWYTWLEQGRGGAPSADVLDRIAGALMLTQIEREHLFLLGLGRPPEVRYQASEGVSPRLQRVLDALEINPAIVKTATWDVVAWNKAAAAVLTDYSKLPPDKRNILRIIFGDPKNRARQASWEDVARYVVGAFRADATRYGASDRAKALVAELSAQSPEFAAMWRENDVRRSGEGTKQLRLPRGGMVGLEFSSFAVDGRPDLGLVVYSPTTPQDADKIRKLVKEINKRKDSSFRGGPKGRAPE
ncbi:MAG: helix-turn-helix domain-containing protein [Proteobacteria bacterium]|nr:helix-turn-helix domain-containing protein [Pseudomonadota bacterium]